MTKSNKILTSEYLGWHAKLSRLPNILTDKIRSKLYKKYKKKLDKLGLNKLSEYKKNSQRI